MNDVQKVMKVKDVYVEMQVKYLKTADGNKRQWFASDVSVNLDDKQTKYDQIIIEFSHIDADNPEFFLQPGQLIKVLNGEIRTSQTGVFFNINSFRQTNDEERNTINHI